MKTAYLCYVLLAAGVVAFVGCKKSDTEHPTVVNGVQLDTAKFGQVFDGAPPELHRVVFDIQLNIRYSKYVLALEGLDKLSNDSTLNEEQKKTVSLLIEEVKQLATKAQATGAQ